MTIKSSGRENECTIYNGPKIFPQRIFTLMDHEGNFINKKSTHNKKYVKQHQFYFMCMFKLSVSVST